MALNGLGVEIGAGPKGELCVDSTVLGLMQRTVTLEEKVSQLFELLRDPVYLYLTAVPLEFQMVKFRLSPGSIHSGLTFGSIASSAVSRSRRAAKVGFAGHFMARSTMVNEISP